MGCIVIALNHDIYVSFYYEDLKNGGGNRVAAYWHNDSIVTLSDNSVDAYANGIFVDGEDVYVVGSSGGAAVYWKNGVERVLPICSSFFRNKDSVPCSAEVIVTYRFIWRVTMPIEVNYRICSCDRDFLHLVEFMIRTRPIDSLAVYLQPLTEI